MAAFEIGYSLFGDSADPLSRVHKIRTDVEQITPRNRLDRPVTAYVFGGDNYEFVRAQGHPAELIDERPLVVHTAAESGVRPTAWKHKALAWKYALERHDEILFLDWDVRVLQRVNMDHVFRELRKKSFFQAPLLMYRTRQVFHRDQMPGTTDRRCFRKVPGAGFVYLRGDDGRHAVKRILDLMTANPKFREEQAMALFMDEMYGGWKGVENWLKHHEPYCCRLPRRMEGVGEAAKSKTALFEFC